MGKRKILYRSQTEYNNILVTQEGSKLTLYSPPTTRQTAIDINNPLFSHLEYARNILPCLVFSQNPENILVLGLGGGAIPMILANINKLFSIDVVEIDPEMAVVAKKFFNFKTTPKAGLFIEDAFQFIKNSKKKYDIIIMDAYLGNDLPESLSTFEFFKESRKHLSGNGILVANLMTSNRSYYKRMLKTINSVFNEMWLLDGETSSNTIVFAMNRKISRLEMASKALFLKKKFPPDFPLMKAIFKIKKSKPKK